MTGEGHRPPYSQAKRRAMTPMWICNKISPLDRRERKRGLYTSARKPWNVSTMPLVFTRFKDEEQVAS